ncbi:transposase [Azospirillum sp. A26]
MAETLEPGTIVAHVARRYGEAESFLYTWRSPAGRWNG